MGATPWRFNSSPPHQRSLSVPKAPRAAQVGIGAVALLLILYSASIVHLSQKSAGGRVVVPGQLVVVHLDGAWNEMRSSDPSVLSPISVTLSPSAGGYFIAARPGRATLFATAGGCPPHSPATEVCTLELRYWAVALTVAPG